MTATLTSTSAKSASRLKSDDAALFGSGAPLGFAGRDANLTRYVGNNAVNLVDPFGLWAEEPDIRKLSEELEAAKTEKTPVETKPKVANVGEVILTNDKGTKISTKIIEIKDGNVIIVNPKTGNPVAVPIANLSAADQAFVTLLAKVPPNVVIKPAGLEGAAAEIWVRKVVSDIVALDGLPLGHTIVQGIHDAVNPPRDKLGIPLGVPSTDPLVIIRSTKGGSSIIGHELNPLTKKLYVLEGKELTVRYSVESDITGLGKELWHAWQVLAGASVPSGDLTTWDDKAKYDIKDVLKTQIMPVYP